MEVLDLPPTSVLRGERMRDLAAIEGITLSELAACTGVSQGQMSKIVNAVSPLPARVAAAAMEAFSLPASFFSIVPEPQDLVSVTFRKRSTSAAAADKRVAALFTEAARLWREASRRSGFRTTDLPTVEDHGGSIETAAICLRRRDGLDDEAPITNVTRMAERRGVGVIHTLDPNLPHSHDHSGVSRPSRTADRPLVAMVADQPGAVARFTIAHELGHLIFDQDLATQPRSRSPEEQRAFAFAGALLLPEAMMRRRVSETLTLHAYLRIKADYGVSIGAIIKRAQMLDIITAHRARSLYIQLSSQGWRNNEPVPVPAERPSLMNQATHRAWPINTVGAAAEAVGVKKDLAAAWIGEKDSTTADSMATGSTANIVSLMDRRKTPR